MKPFAVKTSAPDQRALFTTDDHFPAVSEQADEELCLLIQEFKPTSVYNLGDVVDNRELSRFNAQTVHVEIMENGGKSMGEIYTNAVDRIDRRMSFAPKGTPLYVLDGNHDANTDKVLRSFAHLLGDFNPLTSAWQKSKSIVHLFKGYPNNDVVLLRDPLVVISHGGAGTSGNHAKATWTRDYQLGCSRIYGHAHDPQFWDGEFAVSEQARDSRFSIALGAMCDRSHKYFDYATLRARNRWVPTALLMTISKGYAHFERVDLTPEPLPFVKPTLIGKDLNV